MRDMVIAFALMYVKFNAIIFRDLIYQCVVAIAQHNNRAVLQAAARWFHGSIGSALLYILKTHFRLIFLLVDEM